MFAYLTEETITTVGKHIFRIKILGKGGNSKLIGPLSMEIVEGEIPLVFPTHIINPKWGLTEIQVHEPYKVIAFIIVPNVIHSFMTYDEPTNKLMFDTRTTPRNHYNIIVQFNGPYAEEPVIRELKMDVKKFVAEIEKKSDNSTDSTNTTVLVKNETLPEKIE
jgi:hypothetical protein